jgi:hypothetical protein
MGFGHMGSTSNIGACIPAACTAAFFSKMYDPIPSAMISETITMTRKLFRFMRFSSLSESVAFRLRRETQYFSSD